MKYRIFAALELPDAVRLGLAGLQDRLSAAVPGDSVRWASPDGTHLTVKFYGDVDTERLPEIQAGLARAAAGSPPIGVSVQGLGVFPNPQRPQVIWAGIAGDLSGLQALQAAVEAEAGPLGFKPDERGFTPHLTLGRVKERLGVAEHKALLDYLSASQQLQLGEIWADHLTLLRSQLRAGGSLYTPLFAAPFGLLADAGGPSVPIEETPPGND